MSSSNLVRIAYKEQVAAGAIPAGDWSTMRKTSDSLTGTPTTAESEEARSDRQSNGQVAVGLEVNGDINFEMAGSDCYFDFIRSAMKQKVWTPPVTVTATLTLDAVAKTITRPAGDFVADGLKVGQIFQLTGFVNPKNAGKMVYLSSVAALSIGVIGNDLVNEVGTAGSVPESLKIGFDDVLFAVEKNFLDLTDKSILYMDELVDVWTMAFAYGEIVDGTFSMLGAGYELPSPPATDAVTVAPATSEMPLNASSDIGLTIVDGVAVDFCIQSFGFTLNNNHDPMNCMGHIAPEGYSPGTAAIEINMSAYLVNENFGYLQKKLSLVPVDVTYSARNADGGIAIRFPAAQLSFPDPASAGRDEQVTLDMAGTAKPGADGQSMYVYRLT